MTNLGPPTAMKVTAEHLRRNAYLYLLTELRRSVPG
jgi:hypothetical protein